MNKYVKNFFFSKMASGIKSELKKAKLDHGELLRISYIGTPDRIVQRNTFEKHEGDVVLTKEDTKRLGQLIGIDFEKESSYTKSFIAILDFKTQMINVLQKYTDGRPDKVITI